MPGKGSRALQIIGIVCGIGLYSIILHKGYTDISALARTHSGEVFWREVGRYFLGNLAGGAKSPADPPRPAE